MSQSNPSRICSNITDHQLFKSSKADPSTESLVGTVVGGAQLSQLKEVAMDGALANEVGIGSTLNGGQPNYPIAVNSSKPLIVNGKAGVTYVSADFCPYCAITRWGLIIALLRFGNFTGLRYMFSSPTDVPSSISTFTFSNSSYYSDSVYFDAVETANMTGKPLGMPDALESATFMMYDRNNTKLPQEARGSIPFIDFGNKSVQIGAGAQVQVLQGESWDQIIKQLNDTSLPVSQAVIGSANIFTAYICRIDANISQTGTCQQTYVKKITGT